MIKANTSNLRESDKVARYRKDTLHSGYKILDPATGETIVDARVYWPGSVAYACVWVFGDSAYGRGAGKADGGGFCKESAAIDAAIRDAGVTLSEPVGGRGVRAAEDALQAIARAVTGKRKFYLVRCHA